MEVALPLSVVKQAGDFTVTVRALSQLVTRSATLKVKVQVRERERERERENEIYSINYSKL